MKSILIILMAFVFNFQYLIAQDPPIDSIVVKENLKKLDKTINEVKVLSKQVDQTAKDRETIIDRLERFISRLSKKNSLSNNKAKIDSIRVALKPEEYQVLIPEQIPQIEQKPKTFFGRLFSSAKYKKLYYVVDVDSNKIYISQP